MGSRKRIVYAASSAKGPQKQQIVGSAANGWDEIFDGKRHQVAVHVAPRRIQFYHNCGVKGGNFLAESRHLDNELKLNIVTKVNGDPVPILFDNLEIKEDSQAQEEGICCPNMVEPQLFKCIIEGYNGFQQIPLNLPPVLESCQKGEPGSRGLTGLTGSVR